MADLIVSLLGREVFRLERYPDLPAEPVADPGFEDIGRVEHFDGGHFERDHDQPRRFGFSTTPPGTEFD